ncbi:MAG TPA: VWA domain-containing protein [Terriglobia bacterium]|nr:VWA domain-containing protein [Terriglobia bacterium]
MRFLALTGLQAALLALAVAGVIVGLYFLKLRHKRMVIASSMLWSRVLDDNQAQSLWEKLRRVVSIVAAILIGLLIALAMARPEVHVLTGGGERTLLVLDSSPSMLARTSDGRTRWERAVEAAIQTVNASAPSSEFRVADTAGRVDAAPTTDRRQVREALERMRPTSGTPRFPEKGPDITIVRYITDGVVPVALPRGTIRESVFEEAENVAITAFEIRSTATSALAYEAYLEVHNYGQRDRETRLTIAGPGGQSIERTMNLKAGGEFGGPFDLSKFEGGGIRATIQASGDALSLDDVAYAYLPINRTAKTLLVTNGSPYLEALLKLDPLVDLTIIKPSQYQPDPSFDAYVFEDFVPINPPPRPALFVGETAKTTWLPQPKGTLSKPRFATWAEDHPVMRYVSLHDVAVERASRMDNTGIQVLAETAEHAPLIVASEEQYRPRWVLLAFSLKSSDFPLHSGFPLFIDNALGWLSREGLALRRQPGIVNVPLANAEIKALNGDVLESYQRGNATIFEATEPGLYIATHEDTRQYVAVNLASSQYSNLNRTISQRDVPAAVNAGWLQQELWFYMIGAAALLLVLEWYTYHRRITV